MPTTTSFNAYHIYTLRKSFPLGRQTVDRVLLLTNSLLSNRPEQTLVSVIPLVDTTIERGSKLSIAFVARRDRRIGGDAFHTLYGNIGSVMPMPRIAMKPTSGVPILMQEEKDLKAKLANYYGL